MNATDAAAKMPEHLVSTSTLWMVISFLLMLIIGCLVYWRNRTDKKGDDIIDKLGQVIENQHRLELNIEKSVSTLDHHTNDLRRIGTKQDRQNEMMVNIDKDMAVFREWQKRVEDKLGMQ